VLALRNEAERYVGLAPKIAKPFNCLQKPFNCLQKPGIFLSIRFIFWSPNRALSMTYADPALFFFEPPRRTLQRAPMRPLAPVPPAQRTSFEALCLWQRAPQDEAGAETPISEDRHWELSRFRQRRLRAVCSCLQSSFRSPPPYRASEGLAPFYDRGRFGRPLSDFRAASLIARKRRTLSSSLLSPRGPGKDRPTVETIRRECAA
jgi:hypothetical protein